MSEHDAHVRKMLAAAHFEVPTEEDRRAAAIIADAERGAEERRARGIARPDDRRWAVTRVERISLRVGEVEHLLEMEEARQLAEALDSLVGRWG